MFHFLSINFLKSKTVPNNFCHIMCVCVCVCVCVLHACKCGAATLSKQEVVYILIANSAVSVLFKLREIRVFVLIAIQMFHSTCK